MNNKIVWLCIISILCSITIGGLSGYYALKLSENSNLQKSKTEENIGTQVNTKSAKESINKPATKEKENKELIKDEKHDKFIEKANNNSQKLVKKNLIDETTSYKKLVPIKAELTAYCNCEICSEEWGSRTAMMTHNRVGVVAAPKEIPLGKKVYIPLLKNYKKDGIFSVEDRGGAVKIKDDGTYIIDVWLTNHKDVIKFGRQKCTIYVIKNSK